MASKCEICCEIILAILLPPLGVEFFICLLLTILGYVPGIIYALYAIVFVDRDMSGGDFYRYPMMVHDFMRLYLEVCLIKNVASIVGWYYIHNRVRVIKRVPKSHKGWHSRYFFIQRPSNKWEFPNYEKKGFLAPNATTKKLIDHIKRRGDLNIDDPLTDQEMRHAGLIPPAPTMPVPPTPIVDSRVVLGHTTQVLAIGTSSSRTPSLGRV
ncbi:hypothetical protein RJ639_014120 [Escallonia herrerae]|uniref:Uncharacterized protein n=1 Tax=Escallonia herrerae TaxID=1293975 RepID=A0AA89AM31_9ASTE|nr:hypothetical protein RJ639_014120 [Escallonia herrerae]